MLAVNTKNDAVAAPKPANDQLARPSAASVMTLDAANDDAAVQTMSEEPADEAASASSWLLDWTRAWTTVAASMIDASAASLEAIGTISASPTSKSEAKPEVSLWSQPARTERPRSWYRPPQPNLLDPTAWGFPAPLAVYGVTVTPQMAMGFNPGFNPMQASFLPSPFLPAASPMAAMMQMMQPSAMTGFGLPFQQPSPYANPFARQPENPMTAWMSGFAPQPTNPWASLTKAMTGALAPTPYSSYRSDSGHAVAQIAEPAAKAPSAQEAVVAFWNLFAWPTPARAN
jgi:hypothetical protein